MGGYHSATEIIVSCSLLLLITLMEGVKQALLKSLERNMETHLEIIQPFKAESMTGSAMTLLLVLVKS